MRDSTLTHVYALTHARSHARDLARRTPYVNLTWTVLSADVDFKRLQRGQLCNHFSRADLTTKVGLLQCLRDAACDDHHPGTFFPRCYDLTNDKQMSEFEFDFNLTAAAAVLQRFLSHGPAATGATGVP